MMQITGNDELRRYLLDRNDILVSTNLSNEEELFNNETSESAIEIESPNNLAPNVVNIVTLIGSWFGRVKSHIVSGFGNLQYICYVINLYDSVV